MAPANVCRAAQTLSLLSNPQRLRVLCHLADKGELSVAQLLAEVNLSASALSQHLARLREEGILSSRKERQSVFYQIEREDIRRILALLHELYCPRKT